MSNARLSRLKWHQMLPSKWLFFTQMIVQYDLRLVSQCIYWIFFAFYTKQALIRRIWIVRLGLNWPTAFFYFHLWWSSADKLVIILNKPSWVHLSCGKIKEREMFFWALGGWWGLPAGFPIQLLWAELDSAVSLFSFIIQMQAMKVHHGE